MLGRMLGWIAVLVVALVLLFFLFGRDVQAGLVDSRGAALPSMLQPHSQVRQPDRGMGE